MAAVMEILVGLLVLFGAGNFALKKIHDEVRAAAIEKVHRGLPSLEVYTQRLSGKKFQWDERGQRSGHAKRKKTSKNL